MKKREFIKLLAEKGVFKSKMEATEKFETILDTINEVLKKEEELNIIGWGKFEMVERPARTGRNPRTGEPLDIPAKKALKFKAGKNLIEELQK